MMNDLENFLKNILELLKTILGCLIGAIIGLAISISFLDQIYTTLDPQGMELWSLMIKIIGIVVGGVIGCMLVRLFTKP